jgi:hypothetical protein
VGEMLQTYAAALDRMWDYRRRICARWRWWLGQ